MEEVKRRNRPGTTLKNKENILPFSPVGLKAPFLLRLGAALADYIIIVSVPVLGLLAGKLLGSGGSSFELEIGNAGWLLAIFVAVTDILLLPAMCGQSVGKMLTGLRIVRIDGRSPSIGAIVFRQTFGYLLALCSLGIGFLISAFSSKGRALHDYVAGTVVIYAYKRFK